MSGPDARTFAQSQFTGDINHADEHHWMPTAWCDPKGRCLSVILLKTHQDSVHLVFPLAQTETLKRLQLFAIGRKVEFIPSKRVCASIEPSSAPMAGGTLPGPAKRWLWLADESVARPPSSDWLRRWQLADMAAAIPWLTSRTSARFLPQFLDLEAHEGLSFRKGCYPGQEVIARLHYLGTVKYRLSAFRSQDVVNRWSPGDPLQLINEDGKLEVLDALENDGQQVGLVVVPAALAAGQTVSITDSGRQPATLQLVHPSTLC